MWESKRVCGRESVGERGRERALERARAWERGMGESGRTREGAGDIESGENERENVRKEERVCVGEGKICKSTYLHIYEY